MAQRNGVTQIEPGVIDGVSWIHGLGYFPHVSLAEDRLRLRETMASYATHFQDLKVNPEAAPDDWYFFSGVPVGDGLIDNVAPARMLRDADYEGLLAVETDFLHPDYHADEHATIRKSVAGLRHIVEEIG